MASFCGAPAAGDYRSRPAGGGLIFRLTKCEGGHVALAVSGRLPQRVRNRQPEGKPPMSALPPKADMVQRSCDVRFVPKADSCTAASAYEHDPRMNKFNRVYPRHGILLRAGGSSVDLAFHRSANDVKTTYCIARRDADRPPCARTSY